MTREYGGLVVGLTHIRRVGGVMPVESKEKETLEGIGSTTQRDDDCHAYTDIGETWRKLSLITGYARRDTKFQFIPTYVGTHL